jgi:vinculin
VVFVCEREKELTNQAHREFLVKYLEDVRNLTPSFISSLKTYLTIKYQTADSDTMSVLSEAEKNRDFIIRKMCDKINEIIRILQLTEYEENEWFNDTFLIVKKRIVGVRT